MVTPAHAQDVVVLKMFVAGVMKVEDSSLTDLDVGYLGVHQVVRSDNPVDCFYFGLIGGHQDLFQGAEDDDLHCSLKRVHLDVVKNAVAFLKQSVFLELDPEVVLDGEEVDVTLYVCQNELVL